MDTSILERIIKTKQDEIHHLTSAEALAELKDKALACPPPRGFGAALHRAKPPAVIAEIKRASPSRGAIRPDLNPAETAVGFALNGATCLSVLTDEKFFGGKLEFIAQIKRAFSVQRVQPIPILRKDFIIHPAQVWETRAAGADAGLLIAAALSADALTALLHEFFAASLDVLVEVHTEEELLAALNALGEMADSSTGPAQAVLGINNRDLGTFATDLETTKRLGADLRNHFRTPEAHSSLHDLVLVSESGILNGADMRRLASYGAQAFLVGESLVASGDPGENLTRLISEFHAGV